MPTFQTRTIYSHHAGAAYAPSSPDFGDGRFTTTAVQMHSSDAQGDLRLAVNDSSYCMGEALAPDLDWFRNRRTRHTRHEWVIHPLQGGESDSCSRVVDATPAARHVEPQETFLQRLRDLGKDEAAAGVMHVAAMAAAPFAGLSIPFVLAMMLALDKIPFVASGVAKSKKENPTAPLTEHVVPGIKKSIPNVATDLAFFTPLYAALLLGVSATGAVPAGLVWLATLASYSAAVVGAAGAQHTVKRTLPTIKKTALEAHQTMVRQLRPGEKPQKQNEDSAGYISSEGSGIWVYGGPSGFLITQSLPAD